MYSEKHSACPGRGLIWFATLTWDCQLQFTSWEGFFSMTLMHTNAAYTKKIRTQHLACDVIHCSWCLQLKLCWVTAKTEWLMRTPVHTSDSHVSTDASLLVCFILIHTDGLIRRSRLKAVISQQVQGIGSPVTTECYHHQAFTLAQLHCPKTRGLYGNKNQAICISIPRLESQACLIKSKNWTGKIERSWSVMLAGPKHKSESWMKWDDVPPFESLRCAIWRCQSVNLRHMELIPWLIICLQFLSHYSAPIQKPDQSKTGLPLVSFDLLQTWLLLHI